MVRRLGYMKAMMSMLVDLLVVVRNTASAMIDMEDGGWIGAVDGARVVWWSGGNPHCHPSIQMPWGRTRLR